MPCAEFGSAIFEKILKFRDVFSLFRNYLPLEKGMALYLNKLQSPFTRECNYPLFEKCVVLHLNKLEFNSPKDALCQIWLEIGPVVLEKNFLNFVIVFSLFRN